jgi:hypothetical protein
MGTYKVYKSQEAVGEVVLTQEGLYYRIRCNCKPTNEILRLVCRSTQEETVIGVCAPTEWGFGIERRVPVKKMGQPPLEFQLLGEMDMQGDFYKLTDRLPDVLLDKLERCRFVVRDGVAGLRIMD